MMDTKRGQRGGRRGKGAYYYFTDLEVAYVFLSHLASFLKLLDQGLPCPVQGQKTLVTVLL